MEKWLTVFLIIFFGFRSWPPPHPPTPPTPSLVVQAHFSKWDRVQRQDLGRQWCQHYRCGFCLRDLFNAAFVSCWTEMPEAEQDELANMLEQALVSQEIPEIIQTLLKLAEFMEHCDKVSTPYLYLLHRVPAMGHSQHTLPLPAVACLQALDARHTLCWLASVQATPFTCLLSHICVFTCLLCVSHVLWMSDMSVTLHVVRDLWMCCLCVARALWMSDMSVTLCC